MKLPVEIPTLRELNRCTRELLKLYEMIRRIHSIDPMQSVSRRLACLRQFTALIY